MPGAICTSDDEFATKCRKLRVHGSGHTYHHEMIGGMFRIAAIQAAVLNVKLKYLNEWHESRRRNAATYNKLLAGSKVVTPNIEAGNHAIYNQYVVRLSDRDRVKQELAKQGVSTAVYYPIPLHLQECFKYLGLQGRGIPRKRAGLPGSAGVAGVSGIERGTGEVRRQNTLGIGRLKSVAVVSSPDNAANFYSPWVVQQVPPTCR